MRHRALGDLRVSVVGLGCSKFGGGLDLRRSRAIIEAALEVGVTVLDTADVYGGDGECERLLGQSLRGRREEVVLATKFGMAWPGPDGESRQPPGSRAQVRRALEGSLRRLQTDWIDLYQYHVPDGVTPFEETLGALNELVDEGKVREIGCCNFSAAQLAEAAEGARQRGLRSFVGLQSEYNLLARGIEAEVVPTCRRLGVGILPYWPLAGGLLTGKYGHGEPGPPGSPGSPFGGPVDQVTYGRLGALARFARVRWLAPVHVAIAGLAAQPMVASVVAGATEPEQVRENAAAADWIPTAADLAELDEILASRGDGAARRPPARLQRLRGRLRPK
jgi:aryl-alcohol dehydrogenase-like predicted oxidoreductase